ncbi:MAG: ATP-binding protein [Thermodesulfobacteriota bacterium]|nr:ATP-binding protein [Thermodesulfobacteriota bacterium]
MLTLSIFRFKRPLALILFMLFGVMTVALWQNQNSHRRELILHNAETASDQIRIQVEGLMKARMASLKLLAERWTERTPPDFSKRRFLQFAESLYTHYPGFFAIRWIDPDGIIRWGFPDKANADIIDKSVSPHADPSYLQGIEKARRELDFVVTHCVEILGEGIGFEIFLPLVHAGRVQGYLNGAFQVQELMNTCLATRILEDFQIRIYENERLIYWNVKQGKIKPAEGRIHVLREISFYGKTWQLDLEPGELTTASYISMPISLFLFLIFGLLISVFLSLIFYLLLHRMQMYWDARNSALYEIDERKKVEETLRENEKRLQRLLEELDAKNAELETFVYSVSHDLKTPLVTINGFIGALMEDFGDSLSEEGQKHFAYINDAVGKMEILINELMELSRIGRVAEQKRELSFASIIEESMAIFEHQIREKNIAVTIEKNLPNIYGERKRLLQIMENLLSNAIKYIGKENPAPRIKVGVQQQDGSCVFFIQDNGIGIDERHFEKIFQVFQRLPDAKKVGEGTGIGLAIVKRIIETHGGRIWLTSEPGKGSAFFFTLHRSEDYYDV